MPDWGNRERVSESLTAERLREIEGNQAQIGRMWSQQDQPNPATPEQRTPEEIVGEVLLSAQRAAEAIIEDARQEASRIAAESGRDASPILGEANRMLEEAKSVYREAQVTLEQARLQAETLVEAARAERQQLVADSVSAAEQRRAELDAENRRLGQAIHDLRAEWMARAGEALARLDRIAQMADSTEEPRELTATSDERERALHPDEAEPDVASDLQSRLADSGYSSATRDSDGAAESPGPDAYDGRHDPPDTAGAGSPESGESRDGSGAANGQPSVEPFGAQPSSDFDPVYDPAAPSPVASDRPAREQISGDEDTIWIRRDWDLRDIPRSSDPPDATT